MRKKYRLQKTADNPFTAGTGVAAVYVLGRTNCLVVSITTHNQKPIQKYAYCLYNNGIGRDNSAIKVTSNCDVKNCVHPDHLLASYKPKKADSIYIKENMYMGMEYLSHVMKVPPQLLQEYLDKNPL